MATTKTKTTKATKATTPAAAAKTPAAAPALQPADAGTVANYVANQTIAAQNTQQQTNAIASLQALFQNYGMTNIANAIVGAVQKGYTTDTIQLSMQAPSADASLNALNQAYNQRFAGNIARAKNGLPPLDPATYISNETAYTNALRSAGLPKGFYDSQDSFAKLIANNVSPTEFNQRISAAKKAIDNTDPYYTQALQNMYGLDAGHMIAHILDPEVAAPLVEKQAKAVEYGAAAARQGLSQAPVSDYEAYAGGLGTGVGAEAGMAQIASMTPGLTTLGQISGTGYNQQTAEQEVFGGLASAQRARQKLTAEEEARFTGRSNIDSKSLQGDTAGQL